MTAPAVSGVRARLNGIPAVALGVTVLTAFLVNWGQSPLGYNAGNNDHSVLSPVGMRWADPTRFASDWFLESAPQPHWLFDVVTYLGASAGDIGAAYLVYWIAGLLAFGFATAILASHIVPRATWLAAIGFVLVITQTPWNVVGSGSIMIAEALPTVVAGNVMYLMLACLITGRLRLTAAFGALVAVLHVQQGAVAVVMLAAVAIVQGIRERRVPWVLVAGAAATALATVFGLVLRPVAANLSDFVEVCDTLIPYHCAAHTWPGVRVLAFVGFLALAGLSVLIVRRGMRPVWAASIGLATLGLSLGMVSDKLQIPVLGELAQATNVYRLGVVLIPFVAWGILSVALRPHRGAFGWALAGAWALALGAYFLLDGWPTGAVPARVALLLALVVVVVGRLLIGRRFPASEARTSPLSVAAIGVLFLAFAIAAGGVTVRPLNGAFISDPNIRAWGAEVERVVPSGEVLLVPPLAHTARLASGRAVVVDCKNVPYGGAPWREWNERIDRLGGPAQCLAPGTATYSTFSAARLVGIALDYGSHYIVLETAHYDRVADDFADLGWARVLDPMPGIDSVIVSDRVRVVEE